MINRKRLATIALVIATFLNPMGFDVLFAMVLSKTHSYWTTTGIFYCGSALFFGLYFLLSNKNKSN